MRLHYADYWNVHHRKSTRLDGYDYGQQGMYFVTVCTVDKEQLLGEITDGKVVLNDFGRFAEATLLWLSKKYEYVIVDSYVVMPNHVHVILQISGGSRTAAPQKSLGRLIGVFKTVSTKWINLQRNAAGDHIWQRNYHDRIIRSEQELFAIRSYIHDNPKNWLVDEV